MNRAEPVRRLRAAVAAVRRTTIAPPTLSTWSWTGDAILAVALAIGALNGAVNRTSVTDTGTTPTLPFTPPGVPVPPDAPAGVVTHHYSATHPWQLLLAALATLPLFARRKYPLTVLLAVSCASQLYHLSPGFDATFTFTACVIAAYSAAMYSRYQVAAIASALGSVGLLVATHKENVPSIGPARVTFLLLILLPVALVANTIFTWTQRVRAEEAEKEAAARVAVDQERSRIARELHDVVTHNVSVMVVQAGAARKVMAVAPERAQEALLAIESGGRAAMTDLRHVMGLLTMNGDEPRSVDAEDLAPPPGLAQVPALVARVRDSGVPIELTVTGTPWPLPAGVDLAAYRVIQEALTNAVKHAAGSRVTITIDHGPQALQIEVTDTGGTATAAAGSGNGLGLIGLRERLAVYDGTLDTDRLPAGGFRVRAVLPKAQS